MVIPIGKRPADPSSNPEWGFSLGKATDLGEEWGLPSYFCSRHITRAVLPQPNHGCKTSEWVRHIYIYIYTHTHTHTHTVMWFSKSIKEEYLISVIEHMYT